MEADGRAFIGSQREATAIKDVERTLAMSAPVGMTCLAEIVKNGDMAMLSSGKP